MVKVPIIRVKEASTESAFIGTVSGDEVYIDEHGNLQCKAGERTGIDGDVELCITYLEPKELFLFVPTVMMAQAGEKNSEMKELIDHFRMKIVEHIEAYEALLQQNFSDETLEEMAQAGRKTAEESIAESEDALGLTQDQVFFMLEVSEHIMKEHYRGGFATEESRNMFSKEVIEAFELLLEERGTSRKYRDDIKAIIAFLKTKSEVVKEMYGKQ